MIVLLEKDKIYAMASKGDFPANPLEKTGYTLEFHDEFESSTLDTSKWLPYYLPHWSSREQSTPQYQIANSELTLQITQDQKPWCPEFDGNVRCSAIQTGLFAGPVGNGIGQHRFNKNCIVREAQENVQLYTPQYGYFEIRVKGLKNSGCLVSLWMIGYEDIPEHSGEITPFEIAGVNAGADSSKVRYGVHPFSDASIVDEFYEDSFEIDTSQYHIYAAEWTPTHIDYFIDNTKIRTINQSLHYPMQFMLGIYEIPVEGIWTGTVDRETPYPRTFTIDYFRAYQPIGGY